MFSFKKGIFSLLALFIFFPPVLHAWDVSTATIPDSFSVVTQEVAATDVTFNTDGTKMFVVGAGGQDVNEYTLSTGFDVTTASFVDSFSVAAKETSPTDVTFNADGTKMFVIGNASDSVHEYALSTGFDVSTALFTQSFSVALQETSPQSLAFSTDGTKLLVLGAAGLDVNEYTLSTGFDVSTSVFVDSFLVSGQETSPKGLAFSADGTKMFVGGTVGHDVNEYTLSTGFDVSTSVFVDSFRIFSLETLFAGVTFNTDGTKMFIIGSFGNTVHTYTLSIGFDVSTASTNAEIFSIAGEENGPTGIVFNTDGTKMFIVGVTGDDVNEYTLSTGFDVTTASFVDSFSIGAQETSSQSLAFSTDGTKMFVLGDTGNDVNEYTLSAFDVSTSVFVDSFSVIGQDASPRGVRFNTDGTKMFMLGDTIDMVYEYNLTSGFDVSTAVFPGFFSVGSQESQSNGFTFNTDGTKMFVVGSSGDDVNEYTLSTAFDVTTASFVDSFSVAGQELTPEGVVFSTDGMKMFVFGTSGDDVNEYTLSGAFDVSTAVFVDSFVIVGQDTAATDVAFSADGTKMFILGDSGNDVNEYTLSAFDVSTAVFVDSFSVATEETSPSGIVFNTDGTKMFVVGPVGDDVNEYTLSTGFDVSTSVFVDSFSFAALEGSPEDVTFNADGTRMHIIGSGNTINTYALSVGFDVSTATPLANYFSVSSEEATPQDIAFNNDGTKMFVVGSSGDDVNEYTLSTAFDVTTASFVDSFRVVGQENGPRDVTFNTDGTKMYVVGWESLNVITYNTTPSQSPVTLTVTKSVTNDSGGAAVAGDFSLLLDGLGITSGVATTTTPGSYRVTETGPDGYTGIFSGDCDADGDITMTSGGTYTCTLINNDNVALGDEEEEEGGGDGGRSSGYRKDVEIHNTPEAKIMAIQQKLIELLTQLIALLQSQR